MKRAIILCTAAFAVMLFACKERKSAPGITMRVGPQPDGSILVPSNQLLRPAGFQLPLPGRPVDLTLTPDGRLLLVKNKADIDLVRLSDRTILQTLPFRQSGGSFTGICISGDGKKVYVTDAESRICVAGMENNILTWTDPIMLPLAEDGKAPFPGGVALNESENKILVTLSSKNSLGVVDLKTHKTAEIPVGVAPYDVIQLTPVKAYVANWGGRMAVEGESVYRSAGTPVLVDEETGIACSGTVSVIDLEGGKEIKSIPTGLHPCGMALTPDRKMLYVACANSDTIEVIDTETDMVISRLSVHNGNETLFGSSPNDLVVSPDGKTLYVANGTDNAICVISTESGKVMGYIPTGWYPGSILAGRNGNNLYVANIKGTGSRNQRTDRKGFNSHDHLGSISMIPVPGKDELAEMTKIVMANNSLLSQAAGKVKGSGERSVPVPEVSGQRSVFKHVLYIIKENRTYDQVFGDMPQGDGDTSLVMFGRNVTPNHHKLAEEFVLLDNFYCSGVLSADGHQWTDEAIVTDYLEKSFGGFTRSYPYDGDDPLAYASSGFIWDNVLRHDLTFRNYGEFVNAQIEPAGASFQEIYQDYLAKSGKIRITAKANLDQLKPYICPVYIGFPNTVSDQYRADVFIRELEEFEKNKNLPNFIIMLLPNDHTSGTRPGMPVPVAAVADNDLALGRIVEAVSKSSFWKETCILVTEDDPQNGFDHVDGHRTVGLVISPYTKRGQVISDYYSQVSMVRTIENILGLPPMNQLDASSEAMTSCFTDKPDFTPFTAVKNNIPVDSLNPSITSLAGDRLFWAEKSLSQDLDDVDRIDDDTFNRIIWHSVKGYDKPYPEILK